MDEKKVLAQFIVMQVEKSKNIKQITQALVEQGMSEDKARKAVEIAFVKYKQIKVKKDLKSGILLFIIAVIITGGSYVTAVESVSKIYYVTPLAFLFSFAYFMNALIGWLKYGRMD